MPRRAKRDLMKSLDSRGSTKSTKLSESGERGIHLVADARLRHRIEREVDIDSRAEPNEPEALAALEILARFRVAQDAPRNKTRDLHDRDVVALGGPQPDRSAFVLHGRFRKRGVQKASTVIPGPDDFALVGTAVRMRVEYIHEHAELQRFAFEVRIPRAFDHDHASVSRRDDGMTVRRRRARR